MQRPAVQERVGVYLTTGLVVALMAVMQLPGPFWGVAHSAPEEPESVIVMEAPAEEPESAVEIEAPRVGIQAGHWNTRELPAELANLRTATGAAGIGWSEAAVNLDIAERVAEILKREELRVDLLPATVPTGYKADLFISLHGDANVNSSASGFKAARADWSRVPEKDDALLRALTAEYGAATGLPEHRGSITSNMTQYYAFNHERFQHTVDPFTPAAILEMGFLTSARDRSFLKENSDRVATGIAKGILRFLDRPSKTGL